MRKAARNIDKAMANLATLAEDGIVVEDGDWLERFGNRLLDPSSAAKAGREAVQDDEVWFPSIVLEVLWETSDVPRAAVAAALRSVWLDAGFMAPPGFLSAIFRDAREAEDVLMMGDELECLRGLPRNVEVFHGQRFSDGPNSICGASWTLDEQVAQWYAAPIPSIAEPHGWVLRATVPNQAILALFLERGESETVLDLPMISNIQHQYMRGSCDKFPQHLAYPIPRS